MSRYLLIRRLRGPAFLLLVGVDALLAQAHILSWSKSWPFYLILGGILMLAERAALASEGYPITPYPGVNYAATAQSPQPPVQQSSETAIVPTRPHDFTIDPNGGRQ